MKNSRKLEKTIRTEIMEGKYSNGEFLPQLRDVAASNELCPETVRQIYFKLSKEGLVVNIPRKGFKVTTSNSDPITQVAFVTSKNPDLSDAQKVTWACANALHHVSDSMNIPILSLHLGCISKKSVTTHLKNLNLMGIIVDSEDPEFVDEVLNVGVPTVFVNSWIDLLKATTVVQDNYYGAYRAVDHLAKLNISKIAWLGHKDFSNHARERFAGYQGAIRDLKLYAPETYQLTVPYEEMKSAVKELLTSNDKPEAILAFGPRLPQVVLEVAAQEELKLDNNFCVYSWGVKENLPEEIHSNIETNLKIFSINWKASDMAYLALEAIKSLHKTPHQPVTRILVPTFIQD